MRTSLPLVIASVLSLVGADVAAAQPGYYGHPAGPPGPYAQQYYYNGRWIGPDEWSRHRYERDRWQRRYDRRYHHDHDNDEGAALVAGIIGFALGAAIVGSMQQAERARGADQSFDAACAQRYRSYDPRSRTYLGHDGFRHYCQ